MISKSHLAKIDIATGILLDLQMHPKVSTMKLVVNLRKARSHIQHILGDIARNPDTRQVIKVKKGRR